MKKNIRIGTKAEKGTVFAIGMRIMIDSDLLKMHRRHLRKQEMLMTNCRCGLKNMFALFRKIHSAMPIITVMKLLRKMVLWYE